MIINCIDQPKTKMNLRIKKILNSLNLNAAYGSSFSFNYKFLYSLYVAIKPKIVKNKKGILIINS